VEHEGYNRKYLYQPHETERVCGPSPLVQLPAHGGPLHLEAEGSYDVAYEKEAIVSMS